MFKLLIGPIGCLYGGCLCAKVQTILPRQARKSSAKEGRHSRPSSDRWESFCRRAHPNPLHSPSMSHYCPHCYRPAAQAAPQCEGADRHLCPTGGWPLLPVELYGWKLESLAGRGGFGTVYRATPPPSHPPGPAKVVKVAGLAPGLRQEELHRIYNQELLANMQIGQELADLRNQGHLPPLVDGYWRISPDGAARPVVAMNWVGDPTLKQKLLQGP
ncbi:MAG TPA: hypothetical protein PLA94_32025, partial [Myxococcota bacterium]|nr:hypothetical protein [Myxococcota bacterium]